MYDASYDLYANVATMLFHFLQIHMGGMLFDRRVQKGIKRRYIPPPMILTYLSNASYKEVIQKGLEKFFHMTLTHLTYSVLLIHLEFLLKLRTKTTGASQNLFSNQDCLPANFAYML